MAQTIQIKRTTGSSKPTNVAQGELFYAYGNAADYGKKLAIGHLNGGGNTPELVGGAHFMDMLGGANDISGTLTASKALIADSNSKIDTLKIGNTNAAASITFFEGALNGTHSIKLQVPTSLAADIIYTLPGTGIAAGKVLQTDGAGNLSWAVQAGTLTIGADAGTNDSVSVGTDTLTFAGTSNQIETTVSNNQIKVGLVDNVVINGTLTVAGTMTTLSSTTVNVADPMLSLATNNATSDAVDIGFYGLYDNGSDRYSGFFRDADDSGKWKLFKELAVGDAPTTTVNTGGSGYAVATLIANLESAAVAITGGTITGITDLAVADGGTGLGAAAKGSVLVANTANTLSALDGGGSTDKILLYSATSDTVSWTTTLDGGTYS